MSDVERWLVEKEKEKESSQKQSTNGHPHSAGGISQDDADRMKEDLSEMQSRVVELGREMAKLATSSSHLSSNDSLQAVQLSVAPPTQSSFAVHTSSESVSDDAITSPPGSQRRLPSSTSEATSPPLRSSSRTSSRNRLPYPTGDYAPSPDGPILPQGVLSPPSSPPSSLSSAGRIHNMSLHGAATSPPRGAAISPSGSTSLPPPKLAAPRPSSISPTPRKRYTVALGDPIIAPPDFQKFSGSAKHHQPQNSISSTYFSSSSGGEESTEEDEDDMNDETIGKRAAGRILAQRPPRSQSPSPRSRPRPQSTYGYASLQTPQTPTTAPLQLRSRSRSSDRFGVNLKSSSTTSLNSTFVDPLVLRKQEQSFKQAARNPLGKLPVGQLVAFFDQDKKDRE
jgi:hypothetical protein